MTLPISRRGNGEPDNFQRNSGVSARTSPSSDARFRPGLRVAMIRPDRGEEPCLACWTEAGAPTLEPLEAPREAPDVRLLLAGPDRQP